MSESAKKLRKAFLNELCAKFGIDNPTDSRRSDAALAFIAYGERNCRSWLAQADGNYANWERIVDIKQARQKVSLIARSKRKTQKKVLPKVAPRVRKKRIRSIQSKETKCYFQYTVGADGAITTWTKPSPDEEYRISNRI